MDPTKEVRYTLSQEILGEPMKKNLRVLSCHKETPNGGFNEHLSENSQEHLAGDGCSLQRPELRRRSSFLSRH